MYQYPLATEDLKLAALPEAVETELERFFANPTKRGEGGGEKDIGLVALARKECDLLARIVVSAKAVETLEVGLAVGSSAVAILAAKRWAGIGGTHTAVDPFQQDFGNIALIEIERSGLSCGFSFVPKCSEDYLPWAHAQGKRFDFVFVDGAHTIGQKVTDAFLVVRVIRPGGLVAFHDGLLFSTAAAVRYLIRECDYRLVRLRPDSRFKSCARRVRYISALGAWYCQKIIPHMYRSVVLLRAPSKR